MTSTSTHDAHELAAQVKKRGRELGFDLVGIASPEPSKYRDYYRQWLDDGRGGGMKYLAARFAERVDPGVYLPGARSIICVAMNYHVPLQAVAEYGASGPEMDGAAAASYGRIARYALGDDYHEVMKPRLHSLADWLRMQIPSAQTRCAVDTAPVMEKELAARTRVGWLGKNTCVINEEIGSWLVLGEVLTTADLAADAPATDRCGTCTRCLDACPTQAITAPYQLDATRCISYLTIEHPQELGEEVAGKLNGWIYGCDICQEVCPWNRRAAVSLHEEFAPRFPSGAIDRDELKGWTPEDYRRRLSHSAMKRVKLPVLQRNAG